VPSGESHDGEHWRNDESEDREVRLWALENGQNFTAELIGCELTTAAEQTSVLAVATYADVIPAQLGTLRPWALISCSAGPGGAGSAAVRHLSRAASVRRARLRQRPSDHGGGVPATCAVGMPSIKLEC